MSLVLTAAFLLMLASSSFEVDVEIVMENEPRTEVDTAPHMLQAEEKLFGNPCVSKKTCGECVRIGCAWCKKEDLPLVTFRFDNPPDNVQVIGYRINCYDVWSHGRWYENKTSCRDVEKGDPVQFYMHLKPLSCLDEWNPIMKIRRLYGEHVEVVREVNLGIFCKCPCEMPENQERNSPKCSGRGTYECGICRCPENWYGKECECEGKPVGDYDDDDVNKACIAPGDTKICSGRGKCHCGICECFNKTSVTGRFCECDACPRSEDGQLCGGKNHGKCVCGKCECTDGWTGTACDCTKDIEVCRSPHNGIICHGFGECICGKCECFDKDGTIRSGRFCQNCGTCPSNCGRYRSCVQCLAFLP